MTDLHLAPKITVSLKSGKSYLFWRISNLVTFPLGLEEVIY